MNTRPKGYVCTEITGHLVQRGKTHFSSQVGRAKLFTLLGALGVQQTSRIRDALSSKGAQKGSTVQQLKNSGVTGVGVTSDDNCVWPTPTSRLYV